MNHFHFAFFVCNWKLEIDIINLYLNNFKINYDKFKFSIEIFFNLIFIFIILLSRSFSYHFIEEAFLQETEKHLRKAWEVIDNAIALDDAYNRPPQPSAPQDLINQKNSDIENSVLLSLITAEPGILSTNQKYKERERYQVNFKMMNVFSEILM